MAKKNLQPQQQIISASKRVLCRFNEIGEGTSKEVPLSDQRTTLCLVRQNATVYAYVNSCPHTGAPLNWEGNQFLNLEGDMIQCAVHGALFRIHDGLCIWGPCLHQRLTAIPTVIRDDNILLALDEETPLNPA